MPENPTKKTNCFLIKGQFPARLTIKCPQFPYIRLATVTYNLEKHQLTTFLKF